VQGKALLKLANHGNIALGYAAFSGVSLVATYFPVPETVTALTNGVPVPGLSGAASSEKFYKIDVPAGQ
jgi:serine protease